ncbi:MAG: YceD family protein [Candidatus Caldatribacteriaceae bacterium]
MQLYIGEVKKSVGSIFFDLQEEVFPAVRLGTDKVLFAQPVQVSAHLTNCGSEILVEGRLTTALLLFCARCLEPFLYPMNIPFRLELRNASRLTRPSDIEAEAEEGDEVRYFTEEENYVNITQEVREIILVNIPMKPLCRPDCKGLCPVCGVNRNEVQCLCEVGEIDPRLVVLKNWKPL